MEGATDGCRRRGGEGVSRKRTVVVAWVWKLEEALERCEAERR